MKFSITAIVLVLFAAYVLNCLYVIYSLFSLPACKGPEAQCLHPHNLIDQKVEVSIYRSIREHDKSFGASDLLWKNDNFSISESFTTSINASLPSKTRRNGTLYVHIFIHPAGQSPFSYLSAHASAPLTTYAVAKDQAINLLSKESDKSAQTSKPPSGTPITHWRPKLTFHVVQGKAVFDRYGIPGEIYHYIRVYNDGKYLPIVYVDQLEVMYRYLQPVNKSSTEMPLKINYSPVSLGRLRVWSSIHQSLKMMKTLGFSDKDLDEVKGIFTDTNLYFLGMTFAVAVFHTLFDFLAFKNDIQFWQKRDSMVGLSIRTVVWRCVSQLIIFLYLMDEQTSLLVLIPQGIGLVIEIWKVRKALKVKITWQNYRPTIEFGETSSKEKETEEFDSQAMKYLSYAIYPLLAGGAVYSLIYNPHKSWYSWAIRSMVNGIYLFGFLFMLPQLFVNYKLKSVAHLPWRAFMYKAFNTFIDDIFAFIIVMPTAHRLACFRDDFVFLIYLYQRWLYPVDMTRVNEFGISYEEESKKKKE